MADMARHAESHAAASLLLLPVPALSGWPPAAALAAEQQPFDAAGVISIGLSPGAEPTRA